MRETVLVAKADMIGIEGRITLIQWMLGATFAGVVAIIWMMIKLFSQLPA